MSNPSHSETNVCQLTVGQMIREYYRLCKPNVVALLVLTAIIGMLLASPTIGQIPIIPFIAGIIGITLASACAAVINQVFDRQFDELMLRTKNRPLPQGHISSNQAILFASIIGIIGELLLFFLVNPLTAALTLFALIGYAFVYTIYLKHQTPQNIVIGGASGAAPPILGWTTITGEVSVESLILFLIIFIWTPPHFWALAIHRRAEYAKSEIPMLPVTHGEQYTRQHILLYKILLLGISLMPFIIGMSSIFYLICATFLGLWYIYYAVLMNLYPERKDIPMKSFSTSIWYLLILFMVLLVDHYMIAYWNVLLAWKNIL